MVNPVKFKAPESRFARRASMQLHDHIDCHPFCTCAWPAMLCRRAGPPAVCSPAKSTAGAQNRAHLRVPVIIPRSSAVLRLLGRSTLRQDDGRQASDMARWLNLAQPRSIMQRCKHAPAASTQCTASLCLIHANGTQARHYSHSHARSWRPEPSPPAQPCPRRRRRRHRGRTC